MTKTNTTKDDDDNHQQLFQLIFENAAVGISQINHDGRFLKVNEKLSEITGYTIEELLQKSYLDITHPEDLNTVFEIAEQLSNGDLRSCNLEKRYIRKDGSVVWVKYTGSAVFDDDGVLKMVIGVIEDISEKKSTERKLQKALKHYKITESAAKLGTFYRNIITGQDFWSPEFLALFGLKPGDPLPMKEGVPEAVHPDDREHVVTLVKRHFENLTNNDFNSDHRIILPYGAVRWLNVRGVTERDASDNPKKTYGIAMDITERKESEEALQKSKNKYRVLFDSIDQGFCICEMLIDKSGKPYDYRWLEVNPSWEKQTGLKDPIGHTALELVPNLEQHWINIYGKVAMTGESVRFQQGSEAMGRWFDVYSFRIGEPHLHHFGILFSDITAQKETEIKLQENEKKFRTLANNISQLTWMADNEGKIFWYNKRWLDFTGFSPDKIVGLGWKKLIHPDHLNNLLKTVARAIKTEEPWEELVPLKNKEGEYRWFLFRVIPVWDEIENSLRWFGTATDITRQREIEDLLKRDKELVENLLYIAAHDLKGPVANMKGFFEIMDKMETEKKLSLLEHFRKMADQLDKTIKGITDVLRVRAIDKSSASLVSFERVCDDVLLEYRDKLSQASIQCSFTEKPTIFYIEAFLQSIIKNLISNSVKYSRDNNPLNIEISTHNTGKYVLLSYRDNGIGIDLNKYGEKIFTPFQRFEVDKATGTGIGLYLIKNIMEKNGGYVNVDSTPGQGTTFYCYLNEY